MNYRLRIVLALVFVSTITVSCKKETVESYSDHFMARFDLRSAGNAVPLTTNYINDQNVSIIGDSIYFKRGGLYHFEGKLFVYVVPEDRNFPCYYEMNMIVGPMFLEYSLWVGLTAYSNPGGTVANAQFEMDLYLQPNTTIRLRKRLGNMVLTPGNAVIYGHFGGYRKGN